MDKSWIKTSSQRHVTRSPASPGRRRRGRRRRGWGRAWSAWWRWWRGGGRHATGPAPAPHRVIEYQHSAPRRHSVARNNIVITIIQGQFLAATDCWRRSPGRRRNCFVRQQATLLQMTPKLYSIVNLFNTYFTIDSFEAKKLNRDHKSWSWCNGS